MFSRLREIERKILLEGNVVRFQNKENIQEKEKEKEIMTPTPVPVAPVVPGAAAPPTVSSTPAPGQSKASVLLGLLFTLGIDAASIFIKNPNHQNTAGSIITALGNILPELESLL
jgi:hypothetical protein